ncbi:MAG: ABC transporter permease [Xanthobacteraceae bacterium]|nr:ABC transporter permease [Xanthobacteraceae bacterium]
MAAEIALLSAKIDGRRLVLAAAGRWVSAKANEIETLLDVIYRKGFKVDQLEINLAQLERLDTVGAWLIERLRRTASDAKISAEIVGLDPRYKILLDEVAISNKEPPHPHPKKGALRDTFEHVGMAVASTADDFVAIVRFLGLVVIASLHVLIHPTRLRFTSMVHHLDLVGFRAVPIIVLINFLIGAILAQQGIFHFRKFGAETFVVDMVGILVLREVGVLIVSIMIAGRSGSAYTAELGSMKMREEIDALRVMGFEPVEVLILPRLTALVIALPLLTFIGSMAALFGGGLVCWLYGGFAPEVFLDRLQDAITLDTFKVGMIKAPFMAMIIGLVACVEGMRVEGSAESLGDHTTMSVVKAIFLVIVLDGMFAMFFAAIGM